MAKKCSLASNVFYIAVVSFNRTFPKYQNMTVTKKCWFSNSFWGTVTQCVRYFVKPSFSCY